MSAFMTIDGIKVQIEGEKNRNRKNNDFLTDASDKLLSQKAQLDKFARTVEEGDEHYFNTTFMIMFLAKTKKGLEKHTYSLVFSNPFDFMKFLSLHSRTGSTHDGFYFFLASHGSITRSCHSKCTMCCTVVNCDFCITCCHKTIDKA